MINFEKLRKLNYALLNSNISAEDLPPFALTESEVRDIIDEVAPAETVMPPIGGQFTVHGFRCYMVADPALQRLKESK